jgi:hypothetical protein
VLTLAVSDSLWIRPGSGTFDVARIRAWLDARADAFEANENLYRIADSPGYADFLYAEWLRGESCGGTWVRVSAEQVSVENHGDASSQRTGLELVRWLASTYELRYRSGWGGELDIDDSVRENGIEHHYNSHVLSIEPPWTKQLHEVGFFYDLSYGNSGVSTEQARRDRPIADEDALVAYLESGRVYRSHDELATTSGEVVGPVTLLTDGLYIWPSLLVEQFRREHVRLPRHFMIHARSNGWRAPAVDLASLPGGAHVPRLTPAEVAWYSRFVITPSIEGEASTLFVAKGLATTCKLLRSGGADAVYRGRTASGAPVLITFTMRHDESYSEMQYRYQYEHDRVARLLYLDRSEAGRGFTDELFEVEPPGRPMLEYAPLHEAAAIRIGIEVARVVEVFEDQGVTLGGVSPELIYVDDALRFTQLTPRSRRFVASAVTQSGLPTSYRVPYSGREALVHSLQTTCDVFSICASLFQAVTGKHPFGANLSEIVQRVATNQPLPYPGSAAFGEVLALGLGPEPYYRPSATELAQMLSRLT